ncbi:MAG: hypothetical protein M3Q07_26870, partial [Pseudobdellovibrionaceae bacterium]|nr:hypothetical protein [Pseudobdellovibrionaceae bacterium]
FSYFTTPNSDTFYGCFNLMTNQSAKDKAAKGAFAGNRGAFVEMHVKLRNFKTDTVTSCATMVSSRGFGLEVYYALHWTTSAGADVMYDTKLGSLNVAY